MRANRVALLLLLLAACDGTGGREVPFRMAAQGDASATAHFVTSAGWDVTLTEARIAVGPLYLFENPPPAAFRVKRWWEHGTELFISTAWAHAGDQHFSGGTVMGEYLEQVSLDLLTPAATELGRFTGTAGTARSFSVWLDPPRSAIADVMHGHHAWVVGVATRGAERVEFEGGLDIPAEGTLRRVEGVATDVPIDTDGLFSLRVAPAQWFADADFSTLTEAATNGRKVITETSQVRLAWFLGARGSRAFSGTWTPSTGQ